MGMKVMGMKVMGMKVMGMKVMGMKTCLYLNSFVYKPLCISRIKNIL